MPLPLQILLWVLLPVLVIILLLAVMIILMLCLRIGIFIKADNRSLSIYITFGALRIKVYPWQKRKKKFKPQKYTAAKLRKLEAKEAERERKRKLKRAKKKGPLSEEKKEAAQKAEKKKLSKEQWQEAYGAAKEILPQIPPVIADIARIFKFLVSRAFKGLHIKVAKIRIIVGTDDVAKTAFLYTGIVAALNPLLMFIKKEAHLHGTKRADIYITPDYLRDTTDFEIALGFSVRLIRFAFIGICLLFKMIALLIRKHKLITDLVKLIQIFVDEQEKKEDKDSKNTVGGSDGKSSSSSTEQGEKVIDHENKN